MLQGKSQRHTRILLLVVNANKCTNCPVYLSYFGSLQNRPCCGDLDMWYSSEKEPQRLLWMVHKLGAKRMGELEGWINEWNRSVGNKGSVLLRYSGNNRNMKESLHQVRRWNAPLCPLPYWLRSLLDVGALAHAGHVYRMNKALRKPKAEKQRKESFCGKCQLLHSEASWLHWWQGIFRYVCSGSRPLWISFCHFRTQHNQLFNSETFPGDGLSPC